tara:strand:- start:1040 stop:1291 length:252 start_codon:yes stop_codon:yes gene_type:complete
MRLEVCFVHQVSLPSRQQPSFSKSQPHNHKDLKEKCTGQSCQLWKAQSKPNESKRPLKHVFEGLFDGYMRFDEVVSGHELRGG